ncbi:hypothetical protein AVEN_231956-1 [Araneus ventricosus]|uniref:Uncharacterized protein n=1 Tax=Araneus ventricosus TaxID=182803 RepID=A0A4Y2C397_ARAVE|nr:hypothetical protein AVEN_231956-1 [Araneus ventricosus]
MRPGSLPLRQAHWDFVLPVPHPSPGACWFLPIEVVIFLLYLYWSPNTRVLRSWPWIASRWISDNNNNAESTYSLNEALDQFLTAVSQITETN